MYQSGILETMLKLIVKEEWNILFSESEAEAKSSN